MNMIRGGMKMTRGVLQMSKRILKPLKHANPAKANLKLLNFSFELFTRYFKCVISRFLVGEYSRKTYNVLPKTF